MNALVLYIIYKMHMIYSNCVMSSEGKEGERINILRMWNKRYDYVKLSADILHMYLFRVSICYYTMPFGGQFW